MQISKRSKLVPFLSGGGTGKGVGGVGGPSEVSTPKSIHAFQIKTPVIVREDGHLI